MEAQGRPIALGGLLALAVLAIPAAAHAQDGDVEARIEQLGSENAKLYTHPVTSGFVAGMNSGWFHSAEPLSPLGIEVQLKVMGALIPEEDETFEPVLPDEISAGGQTFQDPYVIRGGRTTSPTAVKDTTGATLELRDQVRQQMLASGVDPSKFEPIPFPRGFDIPAVPMATIQGNLGLPLGTEASVRFVPSVELDPDAGSVESFGVGGKHSVSQWLGDGFPLDLAVAGGFQSFDVGTYMEADTKQFSVIASKNLAVLTLFGSVGWESSDVKVEYTLQNPKLPDSGTRIAFEDEGENERRATLGFGLDLLFLKLNAAYSFAEYPVATASAGLGLF